MSAGWKEFRSDQRSLPWSILQNGFDEGTEELVGDDELDQALSFIRQLGASADFIHPGLWIDPQDLISKELATSIVGTAQLICRKPIDTRVWKSG